MYMHVSKLACEQVGENIKKRRQKRTTNSHKDTIHTRKQPRRSHLDIEAYVTENVARSIFISPLTLQPQVMIFDIFEEVFCLHVTPIQLLGW